MKLPENIFSRILLAYLPFIIYPFDLFRGTIAALWIVLFFWVTIFFFWFARHFFPERLLKEAFFLWLLAWAQASWLLTKLQPFWILSVFLLMPVSFLEERNKASKMRIFSQDVPRYLGERCLSGLGFLGLVLLVGFSRDFLTHYFQMAVFQQPAGVFLLLGAAAFLWKNQPHRGRK